MNPFQRITSYFDGRLLLYQPRFPLSTFIHHMWYAQGCGARPVSRDRFLPNGAMDLIIKLSDEPEKILRSASQSQSVKNSWITGVQRQFIIVENSSQLSMMGVEFLPGGAFPFFGFRISEIKDFSVELDLIWGKAATEGRDALLESKSNEEKFDILENLLMRQLKADVEFHAAMQCAVRTIAKSSPAYKIDDLAHTMGFSHKRFITLFDRTIGITPKLFTRICRFQRALSAIPQNGAVDWTTIAHSCDYFDQAHFIKEFQEFSGFRPTEYIRARGTFPNWISQE